MTERFGVAGLEWRAMWPDAGPPPRSFEWRDAADELILFLEQHFREPVIGIGHSMGATATVYAAEKRPDLFRGVVLIEPAMVSRRLARFARWAPYFLMQRSEPAKSTLQKQDHWPTREAFLDACRANRGYKRLGEEALQAFARHAVTDAASGGVTLAFPKDWEAHNYCKPPNVLDNLARLKVPVLAIRGKPSVFLSDGIWAEWQRLAPATRFRALPAFGHLLPLEAPEQCAAEIFEATAGW